ncbi:hypothetical protein EDB85DRAFT_2164471 [Lactarius pseudohatsudake]|nr:hypothetical protein EDB85DRAFT_2164471 [Lactarius pseudohatsudake]
MEAMLKEWVERDSRKKACTRGNPYHGYGFGAGWETATLTLPTRAADTVSGPSSVIPSCIPEVVSASLGDHSVVLSVRETVRIHAPSSVPDPLSVSPCVSYSPIVSRSLSVSESNVFNLSSVPGPERPQLQVTEVIEIRQLERVRHTFPAHFWFPLPSSIANCTPIRVSSTPSVFVSISPSVSLSSGPDPSHDSSYGSPSVLSGVPTSPSVNELISVIPPSVHLSGPEWPQLQVSQYANSSEFGEYFQYISPSHPASPILPAFPSSPLSFPIPTASQAPSGPSCESPMRSEVGHDCCIRPVLTMLDLSGDRVA